jgi:hypothetical protein
MKLGVTLDILNQKDTPAFYADTLANRPAAGFTGRVFISTDTYDLYRDTGSTWVLLSPSSTGTITGSGAAGQVTFFSAASSITGSNNLFWDNTNGHLGIKTITPDCALDVNHDGAFVAKFNNTTSANTLLGIFNADNPQWLIGSNNVADDLIFYDATNSPTLVPTTTMKIDGTTFIGGQNTGSGRLNVYSATGDNGIQISGANAPSLRIDNAPTGATKRIGFGISTATNNFIQGSTDRDMCIFNGSTTASAMLFGIYDTTNVQEAARISAARNFIVGKNTDSGERLQISGSAIVTNLLVKTNADTIKFSTTSATGSNGSNIFIGNGGDNVTYTSGDTGSYNTGIGVLSLNAITTGYRNASLGQSSMSALTTGYNNVAIGDNAGRFYGGTSNLIQTNNNCIYIGRNSQSSADGSTNEIVIGSGLVGNGSNSVTIGDSSILKSIINGSLLLGYTTASAAKLSVNGSASINANTTTNHSKLCVAGGIKFNNNTDQSINNSAGYGNVYAATTNITAGTGANTIYSNTGSEGSLYVVSGINLTTNARFVDLLCVMGASTATPVVVSSNFNGFPDIRTYTNTGESISLALTGADNYRIFVTGIGCNEKT